MKYYITAWQVTPTGLRQILGNLDGQAVIRARDPYRTRAWKRIMTYPRRRLSLNGCAACYRLETEQGAILREVWPSLD